jgi:hypothetical protein
MFEYRLVRRCVAVKPEWRRSLSLTPQHKNSTPTMSSSSSSSKYDPATATPDQWSQVGRRGARAKARRKKCNFFDDDFFLSFAFSLAPTAQPDKCGLLRKQGIANGID